MLTAGASAPVSGQGFERVFAGGEARGAAGARAARGELDMSTARLVPARLYHGIDQRLEIALEIDRVAVRGNDDLDRPRTVRDLQDRIMPMTRRRIEEERAMRRRAAETAPPPVEATLQLVLLDAAGRVLDRSEAVEAGVLDVARIMPAIWTLRSVAWLQLTADDIPVGSPLVVEPMLARVVPIARESVSPSGMRTTRIDTWMAEVDGWDAMLAAARGEPLPPALPMQSGVLRVEDVDGEGAAIYGRPGQRRGEDGFGSTFAADAPADAAARARSASRPLTREEFDAVRPCTGFRVYRDADVRLRTNLGDLRFALRPDAAPNTAWNFRHLVDGGFYRGVVFHRVVPLTVGGDPFVVQAGDPTGTGAGGPGWWLPMEPSSLPHDFGVLSMARDAHPDSAGSQFFVCLSRPGTARLDGDYTSFGELLEGEDVLRAIAKVRLADVATGRPRTPPIIQEAFLQLAAPRTITGDGLGDAGAAGAGDGASGDGDGRDRIGR
ncbi:MAG: peptidylprolyl isomerase [Phycisphaerales bacterium]